MSTLSTSPVVVRDLGAEPMAETWSRMKAFTEERDRDDADEIWFVEHPPVFTLGLAGDEAHLLDTGDIDVVRCDRGGQVTYHGPGQLVCYTLLDLRRRELDIRSLVRLLETAVIDTLAAYGIESKARRDAPGVYVDGAKIAAVGLRVRRGCSYHGLAFNIEMDLTPFSRINPCGYSGLAVTQLADLAAGARLDTARPVFERTLLSLLDNPP